MVLWEQPLAERGRGAKTASQRHLLLGCDIPLAAAQTFIKKLRPVLWL